MKRLLYSLLTIILGGYLPSYSQVTMGWQKSLGGSKQDIAQSIVQTSDKGYVVAGGVVSDDGDVTVNHGTADFWVCKLDTAGNLQWQKSLGGSGDDYAMSVIQTSDNGYAVSGWAKSQDGDVNGNHGGYDAWVVKLDHSGVMQWQKCLGGSADDMGNAIQQTTDGGYIVAGYTESADGDVTSNAGKNDLWVVKLDGSGNLQWQKTYGAANDDYGNDVHQTADGGYIIAGSAPAGYFVIKLDHTGTEEWRKYLGGSDEEYAYSVRQTTDGGYVVAGQSRSVDGDVTGNHGVSDYWIVRLDANGNLKWQKSYGGSTFDIAYTIRQTQDGGFVIAGSSTSNDGDITNSYGTNKDDIWIVKTDSLGALEWQKILGGTNFDAAFSVCQTADGNYVIAGYTYSNDGNVTGNHGLSDFWVAELDVASTSSTDEIIRDLFKIHPNPVKHTLLLPESFKKVILLTVDGEVVTELYETKEVDVANLPAGHYLINATDSNNKTRICRFVKE